MCKFKYLVILFFCFAALSGYAQNPSETDGMSEQTTTNVAGKKGKKDKSDRKGKKKDRKVKDSADTNMNVVQEQVSNVVMKPAYIIGVGAAFGDSLVYITEVNRIDNVHFTKKTNFLQRRVEYSYQFKEFLEQTLGLENRTCSVIYYDKLKKALKARRKLMGKYLKAENTVVQSVNQETFAFKRLDYGEEQ
ncbi:MAG: hypothetical protein IKP43_04080 [Bacteroidaceae bacterium]|nr:hypothetical protein [Bacteroidaceae bacterium]